MFVKPIGNLDWKGPSASRLKDDDKCFKRIVRLVPNAKKILPMVETFLGTVAEGMNEDALLSREVELKAEVSYVQTEIVRDWVDALLLAWHMLHCASGDVILLDGTLLLPDLPKTSRFSAEWRNAQRESEQALRNALTLNRNDFDSVLKEFRDNLKRQLLRKGIIELPDDKKIVRRGTGQACMQAR